MSSSEGTAAEELPWLLPSPLLEVIFHQPMRAWLNLCQDQNLINNAREPRPNERGLETLFFFSWKVEGVCHFWPSKGE